MYIAVCVCVCVYLHVAGHAFGVVAATAFRASALYSLVLSRARWLYRQALLSVHVAQPSPRFPALARSLRMALGGLDAGGGACPRLSRGSSAAAASPVRCGRRRGRLPRFRAAIPSSPGGRAASICRRRRRETPDNARRRVRAWHSQTRSRSGTRSHSQCAAAAAAAAALAPLRRATFLNAVEARRYRASGRRPHPASCARRAQHALVPGTCMCARAVRAVRAR